MFINKQMSFMRENCEVAFFEPPFGGLRGNIHTSSIPGWKARD